MIEQFIIKRFLMPSRSINWSEICIGNEEGRKERKKGEASFLHADLILLSLIYQKASPQFNKEAK